MNDLGVCEVYWYRNGEKSGCTIGRADPCTFVCNGLLMDLLHDPQYCNPAISLTRPAEGHGSSGHRVGEYEECADVRLGRVCFVNSILRIEGDNRTVVYRITRWRPDLYGGVWEGAWPD